MSQNDDINRLDENAKAMALIKTFDVTEKGARGRFIAAAVKMGMKATTAGAYWQRNKKYATGRAGDEGQADGRTWGLPRNIPPEPGKWRVTGAMKITSSFRSDLKKKHKSIADHLLNVGGWIYPAVTEEGVGLYVANADGVSPVVIVKNKRGQWFADGERAVHSKYVDFYQDLMFDTWFIFDTESRNARAIKLMEKISDRVLTNKPIDDDGVDPSLTAIPDTIKDPDPQPEKVNMNELIMKFNASVKGSRGQFIAAAVKGGQKATTAGAFWQRNKSKANSTAKVDTRIATPPGSPVKPSVVDPDHVEGRRPGDILADRIKTTIPELADIKLFDDTYAIEKSWGSDDDYTYVKLSFGLGETEEDTVPKVAINNSYFPTYTINRLYDRIVAIINEPSIKASLVSDTRNLVNRIAGNNWEHDVNQVDVMIERWVGFKWNSIGNHSYFIDKMLVELIDGLAKAYGIDGYVGPYNNTNAVRVAYDVVLLSNIDISDTSLTDEWIPTAKSVNIPYLDELMSSLDISLSPDTVDDLFNKVHEGEIGDFVQYVDYMKSLSSDQAFFYMSDDNLARTFDQVKQSVFEADDNFDDEFNEAMDRILSRSSVSEVEATDLAHIIKSTASDRAVSSIGGGMGIPQFIANTTKLNILANGKFKFALGKDVEDRASHQGFTNNYSEINLPTRGIDQTTYWHEVGHAFERHDPVVLKWAQQYLISRLGKQQHSSDPDGPQFQPLKKLTGANYDDGEVAIDDHFFHKYIGKIYRLGSKPIPTDRQGAVEAIKDCYATEVISMGMQFYHNPMSARDLYVKDPELFNLILRVLVRYTDEV